ncbi:MAG TPA: hypothetical protein VFI65_08780 [Streptosporangiaceae bacterium]|nr:hypothetical protein [Streptosporangiaceae bacterium]
MESADRTARRLWTLFEPVHAVTYFSPEARSAFTDAGLRGFWRGYFSGRGAPLGPVTAAPVIASFFNFAPSMVSRALPAVWDLISPADALAVRQAGAVAALSRLLADVDADVKLAADILTEAGADLDCAGRVLASANAALPVPDEPIARLWHAATLLREHRGDAHFAALLASDIDGCEAVVLQAGKQAGKKVPREQIQPVRGWTDEEWDNAAARLAARGLLTADGQQTAAGEALTADVEHRTDVAAARPWQDQEAAAKLADILRPIAVACAADLPFPNPIGVPEAGARR